MGLLELLMPGSDAANWANQNQNWLGSVGAGLASKGNFADKLSNVAAYQPAGRAADATAQETLNARNQTAAWLHEKGRDDLAKLVLAGQGREALSMYQADMAKGSDPGFTLGEGQTRYAADGSVIAQGPSAPVDPSSSVQGRMAMAQQMGLPEDQARMFIANGKLPEGTKGPSAPSGYRQTTDGNLEFIPGGPADPAANAANKGDTDQTRRAKQLSSVVTPQLEIALQHYNSLGDVAEMAKGSNSATYGMTSPQYQQAQNAVRTIAQSYLYSVSGQAAPAAEVDKIVDSVTPRPFESPQAVANKKALLKSYVDAINMMAQGGAAPSTAGATGNTTASGVTWSIE